MQRARIRGIEMAYDSVGSGQAVLLLHGFPFNRTMWRAQAEALSDRYRVITPDLRGFGETGAVDDQPATMREMAEDVAALMDELGIERFTLGGLSMGGYVAFAFYRYFPLRVRNLILADTRPQADTDEARENRERQARQVLSEGMESIVEGMLPKLLAAETFDERKEIVEELRAMMLGTDPRGAAAALRGMMERVDQTHLLPRILAPTLVIVGSEDQLTPPKDAELMHREIRGSRLEVMEGAGHVSNLERPQEFNRALRDFLDSLQP
ncbi:MAG TPA: alpha/beta fold hydrolase [Pyrinomonadaceae bacterium]|nr:alpha/beta fold hydrolase [Pyrinomonadaceae bacterium]